MEFIESIEETTDRINPIEAIAELSRSVVQSIILFAPASADHLDAAIYLVEQIYPPRGCVILALYRDWRQDVALEMEKN